MTQHARLNAAPMPFIDVAAQRRRLGGRIDGAVARVLDHCQFVLGPEVRELEAALAAFCGARHAVTCASGTDALLMVLMAKGIGPGDAVICPSFTFCATAEAVALIGATPVFADVDAATFNIAPDSAARAVAASRTADLNPRMIIQAAVLIEKLKIFAEEIAERNRIARRYSQHLADVVKVPTVAPHMTSVWAQYTIRLKAGSRDIFAAALKAQGIPTAIYYPKPLHRLEAYRHFPADPCGLPVCDLMAEEVISLPMHPYLDETTQDRITAPVPRAGCRESVGL